MQANKNETKPWIPVFFRDYSVFGPALEYG